MRKVVFNLLGNFPRKSFAVLLFPFIYQTTLASHSTEAVPQPIVHSFESRSEPKHLHSVFLQAEAALSIGNYESFEGLYKRLVGHPLQTYLARDKLLKQLQTSPRSIHTHENISDFLSRNNNQVVTRKLRYIWLSHLKKTNQNKLFLSFYQASSSLKLRCHYLNLTLGAQPLTSDIQQQIESIWLTGKSITKHCDQLVANWKKLGGLSDSLIWQRMKLAVKSKQYSLARYLNRKLSQQHRSSGYLLVDYSRRPSLLYRSPKIEVNSNYQREAIYQGLVKLAWSEPLKAITAWKTYSDELHLQHSQTEQLKRAVALSLAIDNDPKASDWLISIGKSTDESVEQWLLSSALHIGNWQLIDELSQRTSINYQKSDRWRYWRAISKQNSGEKDVAVKLLKSVASSRNYYGFLAANHLNQQPKLNHKKQILDENKLQELSQSKEAQAALAFYQLDRLNEARKEWNQLLKNATREKYVLAANLAHQWGWNHQAILAFAKSRQIDDLNKRFPLGYDEDYQHAASKNQIPVSWAYAITRQESAFRPDARSSAGAQGLMQLKPTTARAVARKKLKNSSIAKLNHRQITQRKLLLDPKLNIQLGVAHLKQMLNYYDGNPVLATAAYNAGAHRVDQWLKDNQVSDSITWIEQIPYKETREYVKNVLTYQEIYSQLSSNEGSYLRLIDNLIIPTNSQSSTQTSTR